MRSYIIFLSLLVFSSEIYSQCVSIELSVYWKKEEHIFVSGDSVCNPYLNITYRNNSNEPIYFLKVSGSSKFPRFASHPVMGLLNPYEKALSYTNWSKYSYNVNILADASYLKGWIVLNDTIDYRDSHYVDVINDDLSNIYKYLSQKNEINTFKESEEFGYLEFKMTDIIEDSILTKLKECFVFLKSGETYINNYSLAAFQLIGGSFNFSISPQQLSNYVYTEPSWNEDLKKWVYQKVNLPKKVGVYNLYNGEFYTNEINIKCINYSK